MFFRKNRSSCVIEKKSFQSCQVLSNYLLQQEEGIVKKIIRKGSDISPSQSCWLIWESPDLRMTFEQAMLQYAEMGTSSLLLIEMERSAVGNI